MAAVMIGTGPHKASHTAVAIGEKEAPLGEVRVRASAAQAERLVAWAAAWPERTWAAGGAAADFRNSPLSITGIPQGTSGVEGLG
jgi:hypothetical protein